MNNNFDKALSTASGYLRMSNHVTIDSINIAVSIIKSSMDNGIIPSVDIDILRQKLVDIFLSSMDHARILEGRERRFPWLMNFKAEEKAFLGRLQTVS